jgi:hypothetical protein
MSIYCECPDNTIAIVSVVRAESGDLELNYRELRDTIPPTRRQVANAMNMLALAVLETEPT